MERKNNVIRLTEQEFHYLVEESVKEVINEGKFGDFAKKVGKGIGKAAIYGALGAGAIHSIGQGIDNQEAYQQELNRQSKELQGPSEEDITNWMEAHEMPDTPQNRDLAWEYFTESKINDRLSQIIREEISKAI